MKKDIDDFELMINPYMHLWESIEFIAFCIKIEKKFVNYITKITLKDKKGSKTGRIKLPLSLTEFQVIKKEYDITNLPNLIKNIKKGRLKVGKYNILYKGKHLNEFTDEYKYEIKILEGKNQWYMYKGDNPYFALEGKSAYQIFDWDFRYEINRQLASHIHPYENLEDVAVEFLKSKKPLEPFSPIVTILAPIPIGFDKRTSIVDGRLNILIQGPKNIKKEKLSIAYIARKTGIIPDRHLILGKEFKKKNETQKHILQYKKPIKEFTSLNLLLSYCGLRLDSKIFYSTKIYNENPRLSIQHYFDPHLMILRRFIEGEGRKPEIDFEIGVGWLLIACGFVVIHYGKGIGGQKGIKEEIDLLAFDTNNKIIIAGECTITEPDLKGKISTLRRRVDNIRDILPSYAILPVIFTPEEKIPPSDLKKAGTNSISIVNKSGLDEILSMAIDNADTSNVIDKLDRFIPHGEGIYHNWKEPLYRDS